MNTTLQEPRAEARGSRRILEKAELLQLVAGSDTFRDDFLAYLDENFHVWERFRAEADKVRARRDHYSARTIGEVLRHESALADNSGWKLNDHCWPDMARLYMAITPGAVGFFETRKR